MRQRGQEGCETEGTTAVRQREYDGCETEGTTAVRQRGHGCGTQGTIKVAPLFVLILITII